MDVTPKAVILGASVFIVNISHMFIWMIFPFCYFKKIQYTFKYCSKHRICFRWVNLTTSKMFLQDHILFQKSLGEYIFRIKKERTSRDRLSIRIQEYEIHPTYTKFFPLYCYFADSQTPKMSFWIVMGDCFLTLPDILKTIYVYFYFCIRLNKSKQNGVFP